MEQVKIPDAELKLMEYIWKEPGIRATKLVELAKAEYGWTKNTVYTLLGRMTERQVLAREDPNFMCTPLVTRDQIRLEETNTLIERMYEGSRRMFLASFLKREKLSAEEIEDIRRIIESKEGE